MRFGSSSSVPVGRHQGRRGLAGAFLLCARPANAAPRADGTCGCGVVVIARWRENLDWTWKLRMPFVVMDKAAGNVGRESLSFLHFIVENYASRLTEMAENSSACVCFTQGILSGSQFGCVPREGSTVIAAER